LTADHLGEMRDYMMGDLKVPAFADGTYVLIATTHALRGLKLDDDYRTWLSSSTAAPLITGEIPKIENIRIIETNHFDALDNAIGGAGETGEAILFGADAVYLATVQEPELRRGLAVDLGRFFDLGWVGTTNAGLVWDSATTARVMHWTSTSLV